MHRISRLFLAAAALGTALQAHAGEPAPAPQRPLLQPPKVEVPSPITDRFAVRAVYFRPTVTTDVRYDDSDGNPGTPFGAASDLGMEDVKNQGWMDLMFRLRPRHRIEAEFYRLNRTGDRVLAVPINFGDASYAAGERVVSRIDMRTLGITYLYSPLRTERVELAAGLGIHLLQIDGTLNAPASFEREHADSAGPFPSLAVDGTWRMTRRFSLNGTFQYLTGNTKKADGQYLAWRTDLEYRGWRNLAVGLGFRGTRYKVDSTDAGRSGYFNMWYFGPELYARVSF